MITLSWMVEQLHQHLTFEESISALAHFDRFWTMKPAVEELLKNRPSDNWLIRTINARIAKDPQPDPWNDNNQTRSRGFAAEILKGWATGPIVDSFVGGMKLAGSTIRTPGGYKETKDKAGNVVRLGKTNEMIHPTVMYRKTQLGYNPDSLKGFSRVKAAGQSVRYEWVKGDIRIPEYVISASSYERWCVADHEATEYLGNLDKEYGITSGQTAALSQWASEKANPEPYQNHGFQG